MSSQIPHEMYVEKYDEATIEKGVALSLTPYLNLRSGATSLDIHGFSAFNQRLLNSLFPAGVVGEEGVTLGWEFFNLSPQEKIAYLEAMGCYDLAEEFKAGALSKTKDSQSLQGSLTPNYSCYLQKEKTQSPSPTPSIPDPEELARSFSKNSKLRLTFS